MIKRMMQFQAAMVVVWFICAAIMWFADKTLESCIYTVMAWVSVAVWMILAAIKERKDD